MSARNKQEARKGQYKKGLDPEDARRKREEGLNEIRKQKQLEQLEKRRHRGGDTLDINSGPLDSAVFGNFVFSF